MRSLTCVICCKIIIMTNRGYLCCYVIRTLSVLSYVYDINVAQRYVTSAAQIVRLLI